MAFRVLAPLIHLAGIEVPHVYQGRVLKYIPDAVQREHLLTQGMIEEVPDPLPAGVAADAPAQAPAVAPSPEAPAPPLQRPAATATKDSWVAYTVAAGLKTEAEAQALTKDQLIGMAG